MKKIILYIAMSLDGYIADSDGQVSFLEGDGSDPSNLGTYQSFMDHIDTVIMGYETYRQLKDELSKDKWPYQDQLTYVLTHKVLEDLEHIKFIQDPNIDWMNQIKKQTHKDIFLCGGKKVFNLFQKLDAIDQYRITIIPTILGKGISLFDAYEKALKLKLIDVKTNNGMVEIIYEKR